MVQEAHFTSQSLMSKEETICINMDPRLICLCKSQVVTYEQYILLYNLECMDTLAELDYFAESLIETGKFGFSVKSC